MRYLLICLIAFPLAAQIPGQYPNGGPVPGQGRYPNGGPNGNPNGGGRGVGIPRRGQETRGRDDKTPSVVTTTDGIVRRVTAAQIVMEAGDHRIVWFRTSDKTTYGEAGKDLDPKSLIPGDRVSVDSTADDEDVFTAVALTRHGAATPEDRYAARNQWDLPPLPSGPQIAKAGAAPPIVREAGDDRPVLRRQRPAEQPTEQVPEQNSPVPQAAPTAAPPATPEEQEDTRAATSMKPTNGAADPDDPGRPVLRRGGAASRRVTADGQVSTPAPQVASVSKPAITAQPQALEPQAPPAPAPSVAIQEDPIIEKARQEAETYEQSLPNFFAKQFTTRYSTENPKQGWQAQDVISADIAYEQGRESYKNIKIGNKATTKSMDELPGARSTGEFATILNQIMEGGATFRKAGSDTIHGRSVYVYKFEIKREQSRWRIEAPSELYYPAYRGTLYIDRDTSRVLRIEQEGRSMPLAFPFDTVETTADYDYVRLETQSFLLPVESEVLSCQRGTRRCSRNKIEFRNYRKFGAESDITFSDK